MKRTRGAALPQDTTQSPADGGGPWKPAAHAPAAGEGKCLCIRPAFGGRVSLWPHLRDLSGFSGAHPNPPSCCFTSTTPPTPLPPVGLEVSEGFLGPVRVVAGAGVCPGQRGLRLGSGEA